jgi:hypothetical protein
MKEMCHEEIAGNICSGQCQDTARRMIYMGNKLREIWAKKTLEILRTIKRKGQKNRERILG